MRELIKSNWLIFGLSVAVYQGLILLFLNPFNQFGFGENRLNLLLVMGIVFIGHALFHKFVLAKVNIVTFDWQLVIATISISFMAGVLSYVIFPPTEYFSFISFISLFLIIPIPPVSAIIINYYTTQITIVPNGEKERKSSPKIQFKNSSGKIVISIEVNNILYIESGDNYIFVYSFDKDSENVSKEMYRITLKRIEEEIKKYEGFHRVHKSYIVNANFLEKVVGKSQAYKLKLQHVEMAIAVSRRFDISILQ